MFMFWSPPWFPPIISIMGSMSPMSPSSPIIIIIIGSIELLPPPGCIIIIIIGSIMLLSPSLSLFIIIMIIIMFMSIGGAIGGGGGILGFHMGGLYPGGRNWLWWKYSLPLIIRWRL